MIEIPLDSDHEKRRPPKIRRLRSFKGSHGDLYEIDPSLPVYRRFAMQARREWILLKQGHWKSILFCLAWQLVHNFVRNLAYVLHEPRRPLKDIGFAILPHLDGEAKVISEILTFGSIISAALYGLSPLIISRRKPLYCTLMYVRFLEVLTIACTLRMMTFIVTILPAPNSHCLPGSLEYNPPKTFVDMISNFDILHGCGDLIFSSHVIYTLLLCLTVNHYSPNRSYRIGMWVVTGLLALLIIAGRKHYSVDVMVAMYTVPMVFQLYLVYCPDKYPPELRKLLEEQRHGKGRLGSLPRECDEVSKHEEDSEELRLIRTPIAFV